MTTLFEEYNEELKGDYPTSISFVPSVWGNSYQSFLPQIVAIYNQIKDQFVFYSIHYSGNKFNIAIFRSIRDEPYYIHIIGPPTNISDKHYKVPVSNTNDTCTIWFANAWICSKKYNQLHPLVPIVHVYDQDRFFNNHTHSYSIYKHSSVLDTIQTYINEYKTIEQNMLAEESLTAENIPFDIPVVNHNLINNSTIRNFIEHYISSTTCSNTEEKHSIKPVPKYVADLLIKNSVEKDEKCPITMDPIDKETCSVTSCFHIFEKSSIETWLTNKDNKSKCPVCKQVCVV